jgi:hypothetical protein
MGVSFRVVLWRAIVVAAALASPARLASQTPPPFAAFVDAWLDRFTRTHPSIAAGNGLHAADSTLEDFSAAAIQREIAALRSDRRVLLRYCDEALTPDERVDRRILLGIVDGWLLDHETVETWRRNPMVYAAAISDGIHDLMIKTSAPPVVRMRAAARKLAGVPDVLRAARTNLRNPPAIFARRGAEMFAGAAAMLTTDLALAFPESGPERNALLAMADSMAPLLTAYAEELRGLAKTTSGDWRVGAAAVQRRYASEELIDLPLDTLLALGARELAVNQRRFADAARRVDATAAPRAVWARLVQQHPATGELVRAARTTVDSLTSFVRARGLLTLPPGEGPRIEAAKPFALGFASMHAAPPLETASVSSYYYISDANPAWDAQRQAAWLERFNDFSLTNTSAHEVMPGHWVHAMYMRQTPGKIRRIWIGLNPFPQPSSGQDGWAHYAEQLVVDEGYAGGDPRYVMAQASDALTRIVRMIAGIRMHRGDWSIADAQAAFEREAYVPSAAALREAERSTYDPTNGGYFLGKLALLTLREDVRARDGAAFDMRAFHERVLRQGIAPWWAHRALILPGDARPVLR